jgi:hypothetical protein
MQPKCSRATSATSHRHPSGRVETSRGEARISGSAPSPGARRSHHHSEDRRPPARGPARGAMADDRWQAATPGWERARSAQDIARDVDRVGTQLARERRQLPLGPSPSRHQPGPQAAQLAVEVLEALEEELGARAGAVAAVEKPVIEAEHRDARSCSSSAARSAGWSHTRRSRRYQSRAVIHRAVW